MTAEILDRDLELYRDRARGMRKVDLADKYGIARNTVTAILDRVKDEMPDQDRAEIFDQSLEIIDGMLAVFVPLALDQDKGAARIVDRYLGRRNEMLGLDSPAKLELIQAADQVRHESIDVRAELAALLTRIRNGDQP
jgi:hypothetical protein